MTNVKIFGRVERCVVPIDLDEVTSFYSSFSDAGQKPPCLSKVEKSLPGIGLKDSVSSVAFGAIFIYGFNS